MSYLRNAHRISRFVLVWFVLYVGVSVASPFVGQNSVSPHCLAMAVMHAASSGHDDHDGDGGKSTPKLDCPLCAGITAPPPTQTIGLEAVPIRSFVPVITGVFHIPLRTSAPPPARGPPATFS